MSFKIVQEEIWVGTHDNKKKCKQLLSVPSAWYVATEGNNGVLYWPPNTIKPTTVRKMLSDAHSKPGTDWSLRRAVCKRVDIPTEAEAKEIINEMRCKCSEILLNNVLIVW